MTDTAQTIKDSLEVITPYLQSLADKLDTTASYLWAIQVKQAYIQGITALAIPLILAIMAFVVYKIHLSIAKSSLAERAKRTIEYNKTTTYCKKDIPVISDYYEDIALTTGLPLFIAAAWLFGSFNNILTCLFNPEYYALQQLIHMFK